MIKRLDTPKIAIVNYGMGNLFSVKQACEHVGLGAIITSSKREVLAADAVILPGVGAFGDAMETLRRYDLVEVLQEVAVSSKPFIGICLGMQLLMEESYEFGYHQGLGIVKGSVVRFENPVDGAGRFLKVPQVGWNRIYAPQTDSPNLLWGTSMLVGLSEGEFMYFVHSYYVSLKDSSLTLSLSRYGHLEFCSSLQYRNIFACQFHPERSGAEGLKVYTNLASNLKRSLC
jgi:glutamine amidotransferase